MKKRAFILGAAACLFLACEPKLGPKDLTLVAAASLRGVLGDLTVAYVARTPGVTIGTSFGASGDLKKQVDGGAPVDAVLLASSKPVDELIAAGKADPASRRVLATNQLVLIGPKGGKPVTFATLASLPPGDMLAIGDPGAVPAGQYARDYLVKLGVWDALRGRMVLGGDVAAVLAYARRGEVAAAIVYRTETRGIPEVVVLDEARGPDAPRAEVVGATVHGARGAAEAGRFLDFVASPEGQKILADFGFGPP